MRYRPIKILRVLLGDDPVLDRPFGQHLGNRLQELERDQIEAWLSIRSPGAVAEAFN